MEHPDIYFKLRPPKPTLADELCRCVGRTPIKLMYALSYNPIHCMGCNLEVPPQSLTLSEPLVEEIADWCSIAGALLVPYPAGIFRQSVCEACGIVAVSE